MILVEIIPNLWLGDIDSLKNNTIEINNIINCHKNLHFLGNYQNYRFETHTNIEKYEIIKMYEYLNETVDYIYNNIIKNKTILVVCENANQKSASVVCAYLIKYGKMSLINAIKSIRSKQSTAFYPKIIYSNSLEMFESNFLS